MKVRIKPNLRPDQIPCDPAYFRGNIEGKALQVVREYDSMVRVLDHSGEEWSLFNGQFVIVTGL